MRRDDQFVTAGPAGNAVAEADYPSVEMDHAPVDVLVVDDSDAFRETLEYLVKAMGYSTASARDGLEALEFTKSHDVRLMILDLEMPRLDGQQLLDMLTQPPPVIVLSGNLDRHSRQRSPKASWFLRKPVQPDMLQKIIAHLVSPPLGDGAADGLDFASRYSIGEVVEVRDRYLGNWRGGFEVSGLDEGGYFVKRISDGSMMAASFPWDDVRPER